MRILQVIGSMNRGGAEAMIMNLYRNIDRTKVQFDFVENTDKPAAFDEEILSLGGRIYRCPHYNGKNHIQYVNWWNVFFRDHAGEYSVVHGHLGSTAAVYLKAAKKHGLFTIAHSHNTRTQINLQELIYAAYSYPVRHIADQFFTCSRAAGVSRYGKKIGGSAERCISLNNAIETAAFAFDPDVRHAVRQELGLTDQFLVGHVGRFNEQKNHRFLLDVFREVLAKEPSSVLLLIGDGDLRPEIEQSIAAHGLTDKVILAGVRADVARFYQAMDLFLFPSLYEGLPVTMVEAQTSGLPCVISNYVPAECILADDLVSIQKLEEAPETWAEHVLVRGREPRADHSEAVKARGYDIRQTAKWLEEYYLEKHNKKQG